MIRAALHLVLIAAYIAWLLVSTYGGDASWSALQATMICALCGSLTHTLENRHEEL